MAIPSEWAGPPVEWAGLPVFPTLPYRRVSKVCLMQPGAPLNGALPGLYVPVRDTRNALVAHWYTYASPCCRTAVREPGFS